ncbi:MAG: protoheme IX farnesyltransferase [Gemmatimonadetes bacterium]|nr:protoheme IX farnesyltransferase [Gemmatimonadota bacterium]
MTLSTPSVDSGPRTLPSIESPAAGQAALTPGTTTRASLTADVLARARAYLELTKPGITGFVLVVVGASFYVATPAGAPIAPLLEALLGTALSTAGALALNQYAERDLDAIMPRTRGRPLPSGRLTPPEALIFGILLVIAGVAYLGAALGTLPAAIATVTALLYTFIYTPLKLRSPLSTLVGAVPGALPALIGWTAASGGLDAGGWVLFTLLYLWQLPHVLAISWLLRAEYAQAGFRMMSVLDPDGARTGAHVVLYAAALLPVSLLPVFLGLAGRLYFFGALALGLLALVGASPAARGISDRLARRIFFGSLLYLPLLLTLLVLDALKR